MTNWLNGMEKGVGRVVFLLRKKHVVGTLSPVDGMILPLASLRVEGFDNRSSRLSAFARAVLCDIEEGKKRSSSCNWA